MIYRWPYLLLLYFLFSASVYADSINTLYITKATLTAALKSNSKCLRYKIPTHFCVWLSPHVGRNITPVLDHYLPDLVVTVFRQKDENPWFEVKNTLDKAASQFQGSAIKNVDSGDHRFLSETEQNVMFKEADVIGNPALAIFADRLGMVLLMSTSLPMNPYYQSMLDSLLWRGLMPASMPEEAAAGALDVTHYIGTNFNNWGGLYPHEGTVMGDDDGKISIVIAQRSADLLTNNRTFGHIHQILPTACGQHCESSPIIENSDETLFQLIYPIEDDECHILGSDDSYDPKMLNDQGAYAWIVWRHYQGCSDGDGVYIGTV